MADDASLAPPGKWSALRAASGEHRPRSAHSEGPRTGTSKLLLSPKRGLTDERSGRSRRRHRGEPRCSQSRSPDAPSAVAGSCSTPCVAVEALVSPRTWRPARVSQALTSRLSPAGATRRLPARIAQGDDPCVARAPKEPGARPHPKVRSPARSAAVRGVEVLSLTREVSVAPSRHEPVDNLWVKCSQLHT